MFSKLCEDCHKLDQRLAYVHVSVQRAYIDYRHVHTLNFHAIYLMVAYMFVPVLLMHIIVAYIAFFDTSATL